MLFIIKEGSINEVLFTWSRQGVDEGLYVTTWWFTYLGCSAHLCPHHVCLNFGTKKIIFISCFFLIEVNQMFIVYIDFVGAKQSFHNLKCYMAWRCYIDAFKTLNLSISCMMFL
jgi:hypothetical protein